MRPHKNARSAYEDPKFRKAMTKRYPGVTKLDAMVEYQETASFETITTEFDRMESQFVPHPTPEGRTVVLRDMPTGWEQLDAMSALNALLKQYKIARVSSGWVHEGYAVVFRTGRAATQFRLVYPGQTALPQ